MRLLKSADHAEYERIARSWGSVFDQLGWLQLYGNRIRLYGIFDNDDRMIGGFHIYIRKFLGLRFGLNPPFTSSCGPFFIANKKTMFTRNKMVRDVMKLVMMEIEKLKLALVLISFHRDIRDTLPASRRGFDVKVRYTYRIDLKRSIQQIHADISTSHRGSIRKAQADGLILRKITDMKIVELMVTKSLERNRLKKDLSFLRRILYEFVTAENSFTYCVYHHNEPLAAALCFFDSDTALYLSGGYDADRKHHGAGALAIWQSIQQARALDLRYFDFDGSMIPAIEKYFRGFGAEMVPYYRIFKAGYLIRLLLAVFAIEIR
ncbi:MAG: GNAT family N-acetyltransferase [Candidatus Cloacimonetes bacterium]|nr:GNAT family N-acetyltransferase [Candidatus Cloacimonadota bacterium]